MATIADVARRAGVSKSTASRVLNGAPTAIRVSPATRSRILRAAAELGYRGNPFARAIRAARSQFVGVIAVSLVHPFWVSVIESIEEVACQRGYYLLLSEASPRSPRMPDGDLLTAPGIGAVILLGEVPLDDRLLNSALAGRKIIVSVARDLGRPEIPVVTLDNRQAISLALEHLSELGHRRIVLFFNPRSWEGEERTTAFREFFRQRRLPEPRDFMRPIRDPGWPADLGQLLADGAAALDELLARPEPPTAIIAGSSLRAAGLLGQAYQRGVRIPADLSVVALADSPIVAYTVPPLTAIDERVREQGQIAATLALDLLEGKTAVRDRQKYVLEPRIIVRGSTGPAPQG